MVHFQSFSGVVTAMNDFMMGQNSESDGCFKLMTLENPQGFVANFVISPNTYFVYEETVNPGELITAYYDGNAPTPLIYPPQYQALIIVKENNVQTVKVDFFNSQLISRDGLLQLNLAPNTPILLRNWQPFIKNPANRNLIVIYDRTTRSIPAQTTPLEVVVWC